MSTKWNNSLQMQKTPKVCKIPPDRLPKSLTQFQNYPLQAFALWSNPFSPVDGRISGNAQLAAEPASNLHFGVITGTLFSIETDLHYDPVTEIFDLTISLLQGALLLNWRTIQFIEPKAVLPFSLHMITWDHDGTSNYVQVRIMS